MWKWQRKGRRQGRCRIGRTLADSTVAVILVSVFFLKTSHTMGLFHCIENGHPTPWASSTALEIDIPDLRPLPLHWEQTCYTLGLFHCIGNRHGTPWVSSIALVPRLPPQGPLETCRDSLVWSVYTPLAHKVKYALTHVYTDKWNWLITFIWHCSVLSSGLTAL